MQRQTRRLGDSVLVREKADATVPVFTREEQTTRARVVVVGAGIGGMATAARLSKAGCRCDRMGFNKKRLCLSIPVVHYAKFRAK